MEICELTTFSDAAFADIAPLMKQLSQRCVFTEEKLKATIDDANCHLYVLYNEDHLKPSGTLETMKPAEGSIIGCATLCLFHSPTGTKASVEDVVVSEGYRGQHLGRMLMEHILQEAYKYAPIELHLTSNPMRVAANKLYQTLGFERKETNAYGMELK